MSLLSVCKRLAPRRVLDRLATAYVLEAPIDGSPVPLRILSIDLPAEFLGDVWNGPLREVRRRSCVVSDLDGLTRRLAPEADVCVARVAESLTRPPTRRFFLRGRPRIRQGVDIPGDWEVLRRSFHATKRRVAATYARGAPPSHEVSHDERDLRFFYDHMYLPHMHRRFGRFARLDSYDGLAAVFRRGFLIKVPAAEPIAAALCEIRRETFLYRRMGVREAPTDPVWAGSTSALYYLMLRHAWEKRLTRLDMLRSRAFLRDGVYLYKRQWGAGVVPDDGGTKSWLYVIPVGEPRRVAHFFERCPLIVEGRAGLVAAIGATGDEGLDAARIERSFYAPGLSAALVFGPGSALPVEMPFAGGAPRA